MRARRSLRRNLVLERFPKHGEGPSGAVFGSGSQPRRAVPFITVRTLAFCLCVGPGAVPPARRSAQAWGLALPPAASGAGRGAAGGCEEGGRRTAGPGSGGRGGDAQERDGAEPVLQGWAAVCHSVCGTHRIGDSPGAIPSVARDGIVARAQDAHFKSDHANNIIIKDITLLASLRCPPSLPRARA